MTGMSRRTALDILASAPLAAALELPSVEAAAKTERTETLATRMGALSFDMGVPTPATAAKLYDDMDFQRAVLCYLWATPIVGVECVRAALAANAGAGSGDLVLMQGYRDISMMMGSNLTTPYLLAYFDLAQGPMVMEYPAGATAGSLIDWWDRPITDVGQPGLDKGEGATFVLLGPGQEAPTALPAGAHVLRSRTLRALFFGRLLEADAAKGRAILSSLRIHPAGRRGDARLLRFRQVGALQSMRHPGGLAYWQRLADALKGEPVEDRDQFFAAMLKPLGIERDAEFRPNARQTALLKDAALAGEATAKASAFFKRVPNIRYRPDAHWEYLIPPGFVVQQDTPDGARFEERTAFFFEVMGASEGVMTKTPGVGSAYFAAYHDSAGRAFDGAKSYRLRVPPNPPAKLFWSITLYDVETRCLIQNSQQVADRSSRQDLKMNPDGSVDIVMAPRPPKGMENNWIPTLPGRAWYTYFRLFGPLEPYFDRTWPLPDIEPQRA